MKVGAVSELLSTDNDFCVVGIFPRLPAFSLAPNYREPGTGYSQIALLTVDAA